MARLWIDFGDGTRKDFGIERLDRDEVDQFLDDVAMTGGGVIVTDEGPLCIPAGARDIRMVRVVVSGDRWLEDRPSIEEDDFVD